MVSAIQPYNERAAATWGAGGADYDAINRTIADSIEHCVHRLAPGPGEPSPRPHLAAGPSARRLVGEIQSRSDYGGATSRR